MLLPHRHVAVHIPQMRTMNEYDDAGVTFLQHLNFQFQCFMAEMRVVFTHRFLLLFGSNHTLMLMLMSTFHLCVYKFETL